MTKHAAAAMMASGTGSAGLDPRSRRAIRRRAKRPSSASVPSVISPPRTAPSARAHRCSGWSDANRAPATGFRYSEANKNANIVWSTENLDPYLADPKKVVPGTTMAFAGVRKPEERTDLIAYLATLK